jgi:aminopeptidase N
VALVYNKGPLVVHMLRTLAGNEKFLEILKKVLLDYRGKAIDTDDFEAVTEAVLGYDMGWFFDQWFRRTGIPELRFSYDLQPAEGGKVLLKARLSQLDSSDPKALFVPLSFHFGGGQRGAKEWRVRNAVETLQVMLPKRPEKVLIDEYGDLLAKIVYE